MGRAEARTGFLIIVSFGVSVFMFNLVSKAVNTINRLQESNSQLETELNGWHEAEIKDELMFIDSIEDCFYKDSVAYCIVTPTPEFDF